MFAFGGAVVGDAVAAASAEVCVLFRESSDQRECRDEFSIRSGELFGEGPVRFATALPSSWQCLRLLGRGLGEF
jgi:hypothetical protein